MLSMKVVRAVEEETGMGSRMGWRGEKGRVEVEEEEEKEEEEEEEALAVGGKTAWRRERNAASEE